LLIAEVGQKYLEAPLKSRDVFPPNELDTRVAGVVCDIAAYPLPLLSLQFITFDPESVMDVASAPSNHTAHPEILVGKKGTAVAE
jgi:hypothetical protein